MEQPLEVHPVQDLLIGPLAHRLWLHRELLECEFRSLQRPKAQGLALGDARHPRRRAIHALAAANRAPRAQQGRLRRVFGVGGSGRERQRGSHCDAPELVPVPLGRLVLNMDECLKPI